MGGGTIGEWSVENRWIRPADEQVNGSPHGVPSVEDGTNQPPGATAMIYPPSMMMRIYL